MSRDEGEKGGSILMTGNVSPFGREGGVEKKPRDFFVVFRGGS